MYLNPSSTTRQTVGTGTAAKAAAPEKQTTPSYDTFLKLLLAQMKNQNPTDPMKSTEYMGQLATFSQVEQSVKMNGKLDSLLASSAMSQAGNLVGHTVTSADKSVTGTVTSVEVTDKGLLAHLDNGKSVPYAPGLLIS